MSTVCEQDRTSQSVEDSGADCGAESEKKNYYKKLKSTKVQHASYNTGGSIVKKQCSFRQDPQLNFSNPDIGSKGQKSTGSRIRIRKNDMMNVSKAGLRIRIHFILIRIQI